MMNWRQFQAQTDKGTLKTVMQLKLLAVCVYRIFVIVCHDRIEDENMPNSAKNSTTTVKCRATNVNNKGSYWETAFIITMYQTRKAESRNRSYGSAYSNHY